MALWGREFRRAQGASEPSTKRVGKGEVVHFFTPNGGTGTRATPWHFPLPELLLTTRPEASRWVPLYDPVVLPWVVWLPVNRPDASRYCVLLPNPEF